MPSESGQPWPGLDDGVSSVGTGVPVEAVGVSFSVNGELGRRQGVTKLSTRGGIAIGSFRSPVNGAWAVAISDSGAIRSINLSTGAVSTLTGAVTYNVVSFPTFAFVNGRIYFTNGFDRVKVWNGLYSTVRDCGIAAPAAAPGAPTTSAGTVDVGTHLIRYRYLDNTSPGGLYRSNASAALSQTVSTTAKTLTFSVGAGQNIVPSTDAKVTTIQVEATVASGDRYYVVGTVSNTATSFVYNVSDALLALNDAASLYDTNLPSTLDAGQGHEPPPIATSIASCRDYVFLGGDTPRSYTVNVTSGLTNVTGSDFSSLWTTAHAIRFGTESTAYGILSSSSSTITLANAYVGSTASLSAVVYAKNPNRIYWSLGKTSSGLTVALPESWKAATRARDVLGGTGDTLLGMMELNGDLILCGRFTTQRLVFVDDPGTGELDTVSSECGVWNQRCMIRIEGVLYGWGPNGAWRMQGGRPRTISRPIDSTVRDLMDITLADETHASYEPINKVLRWFFSRTGEVDRIPADSFAVCLETGQWCLERWPQGIRASTVAADGNGRLRAILCDSQWGSSWWNSGETDGVPSSSTGAYTASTGSTETETAVVDSLPTGSLTDLEGVILYRPSTGEEVVIETNTTSTITHYPFATPVAAGEAVYAGRIPWTYSTDWFIGDGLETKKRAQLRIKAVTSDDPATLRVSIYRDYATSPLTFTRNAADVYPDYLTVVPGRNYVEVDLSSTTADGFYRIPLFFEWSRSLRAKLEVFNPSGTIRLVGCEFMIPPPPRASAKPANMDG